MIGPLPNPARYALAVAVHAAVLCGCGKAPAPGVPEQQVALHRDSADASRHTAADSADAAESGSNAGPLSPPSPPNSAPPPSGPFSQARVREIVRANYDRIGECYRAGLKRDPKMKGTIAMHVAIGDDGVVVGAHAEKDGPAAKSKDPSPQDRSEARLDPKLSAPKVVTCIEDVFKQLRFPPTGRGLVNLVYPVVVSSE